MAKAYEEEGILEAKVPLPDRRNRDLTATRFTYPDPNHPADEISFFAVEGNAHGDEDWRPQMDLDTLGVAERYDTN